MDRKLLNLKTSELLSKFGSGNATPGSGSAAAFQGILAAQLLRTVIGLTKDPKRSISYSKQLPRLLKIEEELEFRLVPNLEQLFQDDSDQFDVVIKLRKERDQATETSIRRRKDNEVLAATVVATEFPIQIAKNCVEIARFAIAVFDFGFKSARGDSGVAINAAISGIAGSLSIIELNLLSFDENGWTKQIRESRNDLAEELNDLSQQAQRRLSEQKLQSERHARFSHELQEIEKLAKGKKKFFSEAEIEKLAIRLQRFLWIYRDLIWKKRALQSPFEALNPEVALKSFGFHLEHRSTLGTFVNRGTTYEIAGQIDQRKRVVSISDQFSKEVINFTSAHELGHYLLHTQEVLHRDRPLDGSVVRELSPQEWQANKFASCFLMPEKLVRSTFLKIFKTEQFRITQETTLALNEGKPERLIAKSGNRRGLSRILADANFYNSRSVISMAQRFNVSNEAMAIRLEELNLIEFPHS